MRTKTLKKLTSRVIIFWFFSTFLKTFACPVDIDPDPLIKAD